MLWWYALNRKVSTTLNDIELRQVRSHARALLSGESQGARWRRAADGSWLRFSYLGGTWDPATVPSSLLEAANARPDVPEWLSPQAGVWVAITDLTDILEGAPADEAPPPPDPNRVTVDPWNDVPLPKVTWNVDVVPQEGFEWVDPPAPPSPPIRSPGPAPGGPTPHGKEKRSRFRRKK